MERSRAATLLPNSLDDSVLSALVEVSGDGLAVLDDRGAFAMLNSAGVHILGFPREELVGRAAPFELSDSGQSRSSNDRRRTEWPARDGRRRYLEYRIAPLTEQASVVWFTDVTDTLRQQERLTAITRAASSVADSGSLRATLVAVAQEVWATANIAAVQILALDNPQDELRLLGMAGFGETTDFTERLSSCRRLGADVRFLHAIESQEPVVVFHRKPMIMHNPAWAPLHEIMGHPDWDSFVSMPLVVRGRALGVINAYYVPGEDPGPSSLAFLSAIADHAAVAIETAALLAQTRSQAQLDERRKLARDLHDSVVQHLFSMGMQAKALRAQLDLTHPDQARVQRGAQELAELSHSALADLRGLVFELHPLELSERGLLEAVRAHAASIEVRTGLVINVRAAADLDADFGIEVEEDLYRIVQEALHNVVKHAQATRVDICFALSEQDRRGLVLRVTDDGLGVTAGSASPSGADPRRENLGLVSMRERAERWGGRLVAGPRPGTGWTVEVTLPVQGPHTRVEWETCR